MIPGSFRLINREYIVEELSEEAAKDLERHGDFHKDHATLRVQVTSDKDLMRHTFYHELVHALLESSSKPSLSKKEEFVDSLAAVLHQYMQTKKGKLLRKK